MAALILALILENLEELKKRFADERSKPYAERTSTIAKIGALKSDAAADFLISVFETDADANVRSYALTALGNCGTAKAASKLLAVAKDEGAAIQHRSSALQALPKSREAFEAIAAIAKDAKSALRFSALAALNRWPLAETEAIWREALADPNPSVKAQALRALAPLKDPKVLEAARKILESPQEQAYVKSAAVEVWRTAGGPEAVRLILGAAGPAEAQVRRTILDFFASLADAASIEALYAGLKHADPAARALVARALGKLKHDGAVAKLEEALQDRAVEVRCAAIESIAERRDPKSESLLQREAQRGDDDATAAAAGALARYPSPATTEILRKLCDARSVRLRATAVDALGEFRTPESLPVLEKALQAKEWQVRAAAIRALSKLQSRESIDLLIERLGKEDGRLAGDIGEALRALTGKAIGYAQKPWKDWWKANRETFEFRDRRSEGMGGGGTTYYGVPILSKRIIFCLDISGSMSARSGAETRLEQAKKELARVLSALGKDVQVNLIFFDNRIEPWEAKLVPLKTNLARALEKVKSLQPRGGTNIYDTLEKAFEDPSVDTIFLLSDGAPGSGKFVATEDILREVKRMNRARQIVIHTVSLGESAFLKELAAQNGGQYAEVK